MACWYINGTLINSFKRKKLFQQMTRQNILTDRHVHASVISMTDYFQGRNFHKKSIISSYA